MAFDKDSSRIHLASVASSSASGQRCLTVESQPLGEWYKDQGGKKSLLTCTIRSPVSLTHVVPLRCTLVLESGQVPEQAGLLEIPSIAGSTDILALGPHAPAVTIKFRILKVSRNFDNARFVLDVSPDYSKLAAGTTPPADEMLGGVRTFPILVRSKRRRVPASAATSSSSSTSRSGSGCPASATPAVADDCESYDSIPAGTSVAPPRLRDVAGLDGPAGRSSHALMSMVLAGQKQQAQMMQQLLANQIAIMSRVEEVAEACGVSHSEVLGPFSRSGGGLPAVPDTVAGFPLTGTGPSPFLPREPPVPGKAALFRREGTGSSSVGSTATTASDPATHMPSLIAFDALGRAVPGSSAAVPSSAPASAVGALPSSIPPAATPSGSAMDRLAAVAMAETTPKRTRGLIRPADA